MTRNDQNLRDAFTIKDDWPQALIMSMGTLFLLAGLALELLHYLAPSGGPKPAGNGANDWFVTSHPGLILLAIGIVLTLIGYFLPRTRAKASDRR